MAKGCDANQNLAPHADCLKKAGVDFCCRYFKETASALTHGEAQALSAAGLSIISVVERGYPTTPAYFSAEKGREDGAWAHAYAQRLGQPAGSCIFFAADFDPSATEIAAHLKPYFLAVHEAFSAPGLTPASLYSVGAYGSGLVCATLLKNTPVTHTWLAMSRGWRGSKTFKGYNIRQTTGGMVCNVSVDHNETQGAHFGQWNL